MESEVEPIRPRVIEMFEQCLGCKWTLHVIDRVRAGVHRPGQLERTADGLTAKVLNERLAKLVQFGVLRRDVFDESPPRTEYRLTAFGREFVELLGRLERLEAARETLPVGPPRRPADSSQRAEIVRPEGG